MAPINLETGQTSGVFEPVETARTSPTDSLLRSQNAYYRDLPQLLRQYPGQWVAYYQSECVKVGKKQELVYQYCVDRGFDQEEFIVLCVEYPGEPNPNFVGP